MEEQVGKLDKMYTEWIWITRPEVRTEDFVDFSDIRSHYRDLIKLYRYSKDRENQTSLVSSTSAGDKDPNKTVINTGNGEIENAQENVEVSSRHSATQGSTKQPSIANSRSSRRRQIEEMELEKLIAKKETATTARAAVGVRAGAWRNRTSSPARRITFATATTTTAVRTGVTTSATRTRVTSKDATTRRRTSSSTAWASTWKRKKESRGLRRTKTSETWAE